MNEYDIADMRRDQISSPDIVKLADQLWDQPKFESAASVGNDIEHLAAVFSTAEDLYGYSLESEIMCKARRALRKVGKIADSEQRTRRPTQDALHKLMGHFISQSVHDLRRLPMHTLVAFAILSTRRQAEFGRITWADYEPSEVENDSRVMVHKMKKPGDKKGIDTMRTLPGLFREILAALPRKKSEKRIFPNNTDTISRRFTEACKFLEIEDLHFLDLLRAGTSHLFELDWNSPRVAKVTGRRSWESLKRYESIRARDDIHEGWKWLDIATQPRQGLADRPYANVSVRPLCQAGLRTARQAYLQTAQSHEPCSPWL